MTSTDNNYNGMPLLQASIAVVVLFQTCAYIFHAYAQTRLQENDELSAIAYYLGWLVVPVTLGILMASILKQNWGTIRSLLHIRHLSIRLVLASVAMGVSLRLAIWGGLIGNAGLQILTFSGPESTIGPLLFFDCPSSSTLALMVLVSVIMIPLLEEVLNRGFILHALLKRGRWPAILVSSILFGIYHAPHMIGPAIIFGIFFAVQHLNAQTLWASVISHMTFNAMAIVDVDCLSGAWNPTEVTTVSAVVGILAIALMVMSLLVAAALTKKTWYIKKSERNTPRP